MFVKGVVWIVIAASAASCSRKSSEKAAPVASKDARPEEGTMMQVEIEGPLQTLRANTVMPGLEMQRRVDDLGGGRWRAYAIITDPGVIETLEGRGLTVRVVMDEQEMDRRMNLDLDMMQDAGDDRRRRVNRGLANNPVCDRPRDLPATRRPSG